MTAEVRRAAWAAKRANELEHMPVFPRELAILYREAMDAEAEAQRQRAERTEADAYNVVYRSIVAAADKAGAVEGDPRWYGINIALKTIMELRDR